MTTPPPVPLPELRRRPATVTVSGVVMAVVAVLYLTLVALSLVVMSGVKERYIAAAQNIEGTPASKIEETTTLFTVATVAGAAIGLVLTVVTVVLTLLVLRGSNVGRVLTWIACGGFAMCGLCSLQFGAVDLTSRAPDLLEAFDAAYPGWYFPTTTALTLGQILLMIVVAILLALPASHAFFRKTPPAAVPPGVATSTLPNHNV